MSFEQKYCSKFTAEFPCRRNNVALRLSLPANTVQTRQLVESDSIQLQLKLDSLFQLGASLQVGSVMSRKQPLHYIKINEI